MMVRNYKRKSTRTTTSPEIVAEARRLIADGQSIRGTARTLGIPFETLRYVLKSSDRLSYATRQIFTAEEETELADYLITCTKMLHGLSSKLTRQFAYEYAIRLEKPFPQNWHDD